MAIFTFNKKKSNEKKSCPIAPTLFELNVTLSALSSLTRPVKRLNEFKHNATDERVVRYRCAG